MIDKTSELKRQIFTRRPVLGEIYETHSRRALMDYVSSAWQLPKGRPDDLFLEVIKKNLAGIYGSDVADSAVKQLSQKAIISTIDHHGIWNHPFFVNSSLIYSLYFNPREYALVLPTESVSLNNTSSWSGCLLVHDDKLSLKRYSFFPDRLKTLPVFSVPGISAGDIPQYQARLPKDLQPLIDFLGLKDLSTLSLSSFSLQACPISSRFWQQVFPTAPKLLYFPLESLILEYLRELFARQDGRFLSRLVFSAQGQKRWQKYFGNEHTFMFWGIDAHGHRKVLSVIPEGKELLKLIKQRKIYPSSSLCFAVLLIANLTCVGGFTQTTWLTNFKERFLQLLGEAGEQGIMSVIADNPTKNFAESDLAFLLKDEQIVRPAAGDIFLQDDARIYEKYKILASKIDLKQSMESILPEIYKVVVPANERQSGLLSINAEKIFEADKMRKLIKLCLTDPL